MPGLGDTRVPPRFLAIACLCLAALVAFAVERVPWRYAALVAIPLVALDLRVDVYRPMGADEGNPVYARLGEGRLLERPVYVPELLEGSVYLYYTIQALRASGRSATRRPRRLKRTVPRARCAAASSIPQTSACAGSSSSSAECLSA